MSTRKERYEAIFKENDEYRRDQEMSSFRAELKTLKSDNASTIQSLTATIADWKTVARNIQKQYEDMGDRATTAERQLAEALEERDELTKHVAFLRDALGKEHKSVWRDAKLSASTEEAVEAILEWSADSARVSALSAEVERLKTNIEAMAVEFEKSTGYDDDLRKGIGLETVGQFTARRIRAALGGSDHG
jgi:hypothetical protein